MKKVILYWILSAAVIIAGAQVMMIASEHYRQAMQKFLEVNLIETGIVRCLPLIIYLLTALFCAGICSAKPGRDQSSILLIAMIIISAVIIIAAAVQSIRLMGSISRIAIFNWNYKNFGYLFVFPLVSLIKVWISRSRALGCGIG